MRLEQRLTPQLIQSMEILQLNTADLENRIAEELEKNVTLELADEQPPPDAQQTPSLPNDGGTATAAAEAAGFSRLARFSRENELEYDDQAPIRPRRRPAGDDGDAKFFAMANTPNRPTSLDEYLLEQWHLLDLDIGTRRAGEAIIYSLEEDGYLRTRLEELSENTRPRIPVETIAEALALVQRLDPAGIAARDYQECLLIQLDALPGINLIGMSGFPSLQIRNHFSFRSPPQVPQRTL